MFPLTGSAGDEFYLVDEDPFEKANREDEYFDLAKSAEGIADNHASWEARILARFVTSLRNAIATTSSDGLKKRFKDVRGRLLAILADRNEKRVGELLRQAGELLDAAEAQLAEAMKETAGSREVIEHFNLAEGGLRLAFDSLNELRVRKYLEQFAKRREAEIHPLHMRLHRLRMEYQKRPIVVQRARERDEAVQCQLQDLAQKAVDELVRQRQEAFLACRACMEKGDLVGARVHLASIEPAKTKLVRKPKGFGFLVAPDDPELEDLDNLFVQVSTTEAGRLKGLVGVCIANGDFSGAMQHITAIEALDQRATTKLFGGSEQVAMLKQRCDRQMRGARKSPREIPRL